MPSSICNPVKKKVALLVPIHLTWLSLATLLPAWCTFNVEVFFALLLPRLISNKQPLPVPKLLQLTLSVPGNVNTTLVHVSAAIDGV